MWSLTTSLTIALICAVGAGNRNAGSGDGAAAAKVCLGGQPRGEGIVQIVVHRQNTVTQLSPAELSRIYLGRRTLWDFDVRIVPVLLEEENPVTQFFLEEVLITTVLEYRSYWRRRLYSGGGTPPLRFRTSAEVLDFTAKTPGAIGIVEASVSDSRVKVIPWGP